VILDFLEYVAGFSDDILNPDGSIKESGNKMDSHNMALIIAPNIFYAKTQISGEEGADTLSSIGIISLMMRYQDDLWKVSFLSESLK